MTSAFRRDILLMMEFQRTPIWAISTNYNCRESTGSLILLIASVVVVTFSKKDLSRAFRQIPVDPANYHNLGFQINNQFYFHTSFPFGLRTASLACQRTTKAVVYILNTMGILVDVYIDDFYGAAMPDVSQDEFNRMNSVFDELGLAASAAKDVLPCYCMTCLGVEIDTLDMTLTVPQFRVTELQGELNEWLTRTLYSKRDLQRLLGKLSFITSCIRPGRVYMCRLLNALRAISSRHSKLHVDDELRADIHWWLYLLRHYNGVSVIPSNITVANPELFASDACLTGCGAVCFGEYFRCPFPPRV
ncbi:uncharacterized protein LOC125560706 [Nematostella vectensis]|uniref:uncharacterized protein LOC125560706 n=1 Tax=Nematostella vectensis TaxID=45351 RepID=UPI00207798FE|nr:uncharacterized protein LOC125560706 [Nematostella vectensis]